MSNKEFKIVVLRKLWELQEHTERQFNKIEKIICKQNKFNREIIKKNKMAILELKNTKKMK